MNLEIFAVYDKKSEHYSNPIFLRSKGEAIRTFSDAVNSSTPDNQLYNHPEDFDLYHLGSFDSETGKFMAISPFNLAQGNTLRIKS